MAFVALLAVALASESTGLLVWALNRHVLMLIAGSVHLYTIAIGASQSIPAAVLTMFTPGLSQVYWVGTEWFAKGTFWHPLSIMCAVLLVSLAIELVGRRVYAREIAAIPARK